MLYNCIYGLVKVFGNYNCCDKIKETKQCHATSVFAQQVVY